MPPKPETKADKVRVNQEIKAKKVRVVDPDGEHGIYSIQDAIALAQSKGLDLVEISPNAEPPVVKVVDFGKFRYEQTKRDKVAKKKQAVVIVKEIRFHVNTDTHDFDFKTKHAMRFLEEGNKVKGSVLFKGREIAYQNQGRELIDRFIEQLSEVGKVEQEPKMEGRAMTVMITPDKKKK